MLLMSKKLPFKTHQSPSAPTAHTSRSPTAKGEEEQGPLPRSLPGDPAAWLPCRGSRKSGDKIGGSRVGSLRPSSWGRRQRVFVQVPGSFRMLLMDRAAKPPKGPGQDSDGHPDQRQLQAALPSRLSRRKGNSNRPIKTTAVKNKAKCFVWN